MANELNLFLLILDANDPVPTSAVRHDAVLRRTSVPGRFTVVKDRHGYFNIELPKKETKTESVFGFDPDTIESLVDAGARKLKRFVRDLNGK